MFLSKYQRQRCLEIMDTLSSHSISQMFAQPVDPILDNCPDYFDYIKNPMDLGTVRKKLLTDQYKSVSEWKNDVNLIWANSNNYNPKNSLIRYITKDLSNLFHKLTIYFTDSPQNDWADQLNAFNAELLNTIKEVNDPALALLYGSDKIAEAQNPTQANKQANKKKSESKSSNKSKKSVHRQPTSQFGSTSSNESSPISYSPIDSFEQCWPDENVENDVTIIEKKPKDDEFTKDQLIQLTHDINSIDADDIIDVITRLILSNEPHIKDTGETIEVDLSKLHKTTLFALRAKVDEYLNRCF